MKTNLRKALGELQKALEEEISEEVAEAFIDKIEEEILELIDENEEPIEDLEGEFDIEDENGEGH